MAVDLIDKGPDPKGFIKEVEVAIDRLFDASWQIEINPLTNRPIEVPQDRADQKVLKDPEEIGPSDIKEPGAEGPGTDFWELDGGLELEEEGDQEDREGSDGELSEGPDELEIEDVLQEQPVHEDLLISTVGSHIQALGECIDQISLLEDLFARVPEMEKIYSLQQKIRERLEGQKRALTEALGGDYGLSVPEIKQEREDTGAETGHKEKEVPSVSVSCPWQRLVTARWAGRPVAFVPEDVAFCGTVPWWARRGLRGAKEFQLKRLKAWPWSRLQGLMQGELSNQEERQLQGLKFPIVQNPDPSPGPSPDNPILLLLYQGNEGRALILDTRLETIFLVPESSWEASADGKGPWTGRLKIENESISVLSMDSLLSSQPEGHGCNRRGCE